MPRSRPAAHGDQPKIAIKKTGDAECANCAAPSRPARFLTWREVEARVPLSRQTVWRMERYGLFPARVKISLGRVGWREGEIEAYIAGTWVPPGSSK